LAVDDLRKVVDEERKKLMITPAVAVIWAFVVVLYAFMFYMELRRIWTNELVLIPQALGLYATSIFAVLLLIYSNLRQHKFILKSAKRFEESAILGASDLLSFYEESQKKVLPTLLIMISMLFGAFAYWSLGVVFSWWEWSFLMYVAHLVLLALVLTSSILTSLFLKERSGWAKKRRKMEKTMEEYFEKQG